MTLTVTPLSDDGFAAEVSGLDTDTPPNAAVAAQLREAFREHPVLCLRTSGLTPERYLDIAGIFGNVQRQLLRAHRDAAFPDISYISSDQKDDLGTGQRVVFGSHWHTDDSYQAEPCSATMLYAKVIPESGGDTQFTNMYAAHDTLPDDLKERIDGRRAIHTYRSRRNVSHVPKRTAEEEAETPPVEHPLIRTHPDTNRKAVYLNPNRVDGVVGLSVKDSDTLLDRLLAHCVQRKFVYRHKWQPHDILVWDNRCSMHKASDDYHGQKREMMRILIAGDRPY